MQTKDIISNLRLMADTIEELEIDNIIYCEVGTEMSCHLITLNLTGIDATWTERFHPKWNWEKSYSYNNIRFFALCTEEGYQREVSA